MKRILFVDDESRILDGLRRMLRPHRDVWEMVFVASGEEALAALEACPFDVLVTDMRMPGLDGAALLAEVKARQPKTVRIILSGHADLEAAMRSVAVSHQFLTKPCDAAVLKSVIDRACNLESFLSDTVLQGALGKMGDLPVLPSTYQALTAALSEPEVDMDTVSAIVEQDTAIAAKIIHLVNSSYFGVRQEISSVRQATSHLGINTIRDLTLSLEVFGQFGCGARATGFSIDREQSHSLMTGRIARRLLPNKSGADQAFIAAMMHDIGKLVLARQLPDAVSRIRLAGAGVRAPAHAVETSVLGVSHAQVGAYLLGLWGMPYSILEAIAFHHHPSMVVTQPTFGVLAAVHVADVLAHEIGDLPEAARPELDLALMERLGVCDKLPEWRGIARNEAGLDCKVA